jgi:hypothetical protein
MKSPRLQLRQIRRRPRHVIYPNGTPVAHSLSDCPDDIACMKKLDDEIVFDAVKSLLAHSKNEKIKSRWLLSVDSIPLATMKRRN